MNIEQFIIDLLKQHNCVVVPNFGGFIANYQPAIIDSVRKTITPPSKQVMFNANLIKNDGLLANHIVNQTAISYPESLVQIETKVQTWKTALTNEKRLVFGEIGFLYEQDGAIVFEQNRESNLWLKAYGLSSIQFVSAKDLAPEPEKKVIKLPQTDHSTPITKEEETPQKPAEITLAVNENITEETAEKQTSKIVPLPLEKKSRKKWGYLAVACAIPLLFYTYWIPMETNFLETGNIKLSDFNPLNQHQAEPLYLKRETQLHIETQLPLETFNHKIAELPADVAVYHFQFDESTYIPVKLEPKSIQANVQIEKSTSIETSNNQTDMVHGSNAKTAPIQLIAGCFSVKNNANSLISNLKTEGYSAYILDQNKGLYRVAINGFQNMADAKASKKDLTSKQISTWILKR